MFKSINIIYSHPVGTFPVCHFNSILMGGLENKKQLVACLN